MFATRGSPEGVGNDVNAYTAPVTGLTLGTITLEDEDFFTSSEVGIIQV